MPKVDKTYVSAYSVETFFIPKAAYQKNRLTIFRLSACFVPEIGLEPTQLLHH